MTKKHNTNWRDLRDTMLDTPESKAAYLEAERAWQLKELLMQARENSKMTQTELARKLDIAPSNLHRIEKNPGKVNVQTIFKYLDACGANIEFSLRQ